MSPPLSDPAGFQRALRDWYRVNARRLPWREAPSLYKTVVSEFMLQQTQVKTVLPYYARWLEALPDFAALAAAPEARVLRLWEGLGYYSRARNLHRLAQALASLPETPRTPAAWRELPGVGPYTAAAITSIAFEAQEACVDGNVVRILARLSGSQKRFRDSTDAAKTFAPLAATLLPAQGPGDHNQAMMELGATVCTKRGPLCSACPVRPFCAAARGGAPEAFPQFVPKTVVRRTVVRVWCERRGALLLHRASPGARRLAGLHELPLAEQAGLTPATARRGRLLARKSRTITRFHFTESIHQVELRGGPGREGLVWVSLDRLDALTFSGPHRRWVAEILAARGSGC